MLSVIIPSRDPRFLQKTIDDLLEKAEGEIEIIVVLDGYWPSPMINDNLKVKIIHQGTIHNHYGMRNAISVGINVARGEYIMKTDEHCMFDKGFDVKLKSDCNDDWLVVPRRYRLDAENWKIIEDGRPPVDYMFIAYPYERPYDRRCGLYGGGIDKQRTIERKDILIDDTMSMQGSCWFLKKDYWDKLFPDGMDTENYGTFNHEAQEIHFKVQLSGGRFVVNKKTWYAHYYKGKTGKGYGFSTEQYKRHESEKEKARRYCMDYWLNNRWDKRVHDFDWLIKQFNPPGWDNWKERIKEDSKHDWKNNPEKQPSEWVDSTLKIKNRIELAQYFNQLGFKKGVEVGVCTGRYSRILLDNIENLNLMGVDPYVPYGRGGSFRLEDSHTKNYLKARELLKPYSNYILAVGYSHEVAQWIEDESLDFVLIDGIHDYENVYRDIEDWTPKVRKGGIVSGHDYYLTKRMRVKEAVDDYAQKHGITINATEWDDNAHRDDRQPDWWFVK